MVYVQYMSRSVTTGELIAALGDRAVVILDGRNSLETMKHDAVQFNGYRRPVYEAYRIYKGDSFSRSAPVTGVIEL